MAGLECLNTARLPGNFNYYAGGHVHYILNKPYSSGIISFPGPLFPNNFKELEQLGQGSFNIVEEANGKINIENIKILIKHTAPLSIDMAGKNPKQALEHIKSAISGTDINNKILLLRISGELSEGNQSDINFRHLNLDNAYFTLKNTAHLTAKPLAEYEIRQGTAEDIENSIVKEIKNPFLTQENILDLMMLLDKEKNEGETNLDFENRIIADVRLLLEEYNIA